VRSRPAAGRRSHVDSRAAAPHLRGVHSRQSPRTVRAVRGATTVAADEPALIRDAVIELLEAVLDDNDIVPADVVSAVFTATPDLVSEFPAHAARLLGWTDIPLLCAQELPVRDALPRCIRVLVHAETRRPRSEIRHVYLREAILLRADLMAD
jgi:chorismate mutase